MKGVRDIKQLDGQLPFIRGGESTGADVFSINIRLAAECSAGFFVCVRTTNEG